MALPVDINDYYNYLPTEKDFELVLACKKDGQKYKLTSEFYPGYGPYYYTGVRNYIVSILLQWAEAAKYIEYYLIYPNRYTKDELKAIIDWVASKALAYKDVYDKYKDEGHSLESPEKVVQQARDSRKGEITVNTKGQAKYFRIIPYSMKYGSEDPNKKQMGNRMHLFFGKKIGNEYKIVIRGSNLYGCNEIDADEPVFATEQEARDFIANIDHNHIQTKVTVEDWRFVISNKPINGDWDQDTRQYLPILDLKNAVKVDTICGPAWMFKDCRHFDESLNKTLFESNQYNIKLTWEDFHLADALFIKEHIDNPKILIENCIVELDRTTKFAFVTLIICICLEAPQTTVDSLRTFLETSCGYPKSEIKKVITTCLADNDFITYLKEIIKKINESQPQINNSFHITIDKNNKSIPFRRIIAGDTRYNPPARRHFIVGKKDNGKYKISVHGSDVGPMYDYSYEDAVFFDSDQQAINFINNIKNIPTKVPVENFNYKITSKGVIAGNSQILDLSDCILVDTICGPAYIYKYTKNCVESLQEKIVHLSNGDWQVQSEKGRNMGTYDTKKEAEKRLGQVEYFKHLNEGCWGMPYTLKDANELKNLMRRPIDAFTVGDCANYNDELGIGDDTLFDNIADYRHKHKYGSDAANDCRKIIQDFIKDEVLPNWDGYSYSQPEGDYEGHTWENGVKEVFQEIADMDLDKEYKEWKKEKDEEQKKMQAIKEVPAKESLTEAKEVDLEKEVRDLIKQNEAETTSKLHILEYDDGYDGFIEKFGEDEDGNTDIVDFGVFTYNKLSDEDIEKGKPVISFLLTGGLNGSGDWANYLKDISKLFKEFENKLNLHGIVYKVETDIIDDVWTAEIFLYHNRDIKENLTEDLLVINEKHAREEFDEIMDQIEDSKDWKVRSNLLTLMNIYLFQTLYDADHQKESGCDINRKEWDNYAQWHRQQNKKLVDEHPELLEKEKQWEEERLANINDAESIEEENPEEELDEDVEKHDTLNPKLFDNNHLKPEVREKCLEIVDIFLKLLEEDEIKIDVKDIIFTGSNASYNYTKDSDIDLHIIADTSNFECPDNLYPKLYDAYKSLFNSKYDISFYGIPVEIYVETGDTPLISNGIYSVKQDAWIQEPTETTIPEIDWNEFMKAYQPWEDEYKEIVHNIDPETTTDDKPIDDFITKVYELRHTGLANEGQYGFSNLIFKELRNRGHLQELKDLKHEIIANRLTLEALTEAADIDEKTRQIYRNKIGQISHNQPIIQNNGIFEIYNVKANDVDYIIRELYRQELVEYANKSAEKYDFSKINFDGMPSRYYKIIGMIKK